MLPVSLRQWLEPVHQRGNQTQNLTLYAETQLLLLVGDVAADCPHQRHGNGADDPRDGAHLGRGLCGGVSVRQAQPRTTNKTPNAHRCCRHTG